MPYISGQDAEVPSVKAMLRGEQYSSIFKDTRDLAKVTANMVDAVLQGKQRHVRKQRAQSPDLKGETAIGEPDALWSLPALLA